MQLVAGELRLSASDLVGHLSCHHLSVLDRAVAEGQLAKPTYWDPQLEVLRERGAVHERNFVQHLIDSGLETTRIDGVDISDAAVAATLRSMAAGTEVIVQGALRHGRWGGRADILRRVEKPSNLGAWSYEVLDTKLARETKAGTVLQLCLYSDLLERAQGLAPDHMHVVAPWSDFVPQTFRFADYAAYYRQAKRRFEQSLEQEDAPATYPDPTAHCDICRWYDACDHKRREDDHPSLIASVTKVQINEFAQHGAATMAGIAALPHPFSWRPERGSVGSYDRVREQARIQVEAREAGMRKFEMLEIEPGFGLARLPERSPGDIFLDLEGDPFIGEHGLEYLFGYLSSDDHGENVYRGEWALTRAEERQAFERFVDFVMARWEAYPDLHIYHYAPYEPAALKRLMGRYGTREDEIDRMLRAKVFVDLYLVVRHAVRASVESYSIKRLEPFYGFVRQVPLPEANSALTNFQANLELGDVASISAEIRATVRGYNEDDCLSTAALRSWLEDRRAEFISAGVDVPRPAAGDDGAPNENVTAWLARIAPVIEQLLQGIPDDPADRSEEQHARWLLANLLDWHRREAKATWWELFRLAAVSAEELLDERVGLSGLVFVGAAGGTARAPIHRYSYPKQETSLRGGEDLRNCGGEKLGSVSAISLEERTVDIKKRQDSAGLHPEAVFAHKVVGAEVIAKALLRISEYVVANGIEGPGPYRAARDLLLRRPPPIGGHSIREAGESTLAAALRLAEHLGEGVLPVQGPPGAGKTFTAAQMICALVRQGKTVGITANSHKVIRNLLDKVIEEADGLGVDLQCCQKADDDEEEQHRLTFARRSEDLIAAIGQNVHVGGGTAWLWSLPDAYEAVDVLFVDEAAQMALPNVLAVSQAAKTVVLVGDPQQLDQPIQGSHPDGCDVSALHHILDGAQTIPPDRGLFLDETWRLHPDICGFTSELFYAGELHPRQGLAGQLISGSTRLSGAGLRWLPVAHSGNQSNSPEEAEAIAGLVMEVTAAGISWTDRLGNVRPLTLDDILIIAPFNAQVFEIQKRLPGARVGTVDKFQGQEAAIAIYSTATSSPADAPRGVEFLYSLNRLNVATSRAKCVCVLVSSPMLFQAECRTPHQMRLANALCRYLELATSL
ncbi:TM0106 family RecB-like putative nuclease [Mesorhizobium sp. M1B.F.Ca.ET.045.04.1.1]|uniref:TM0106 family RecB-like putative nuclease n=1 Tax=Mesorhizobium sp. M1B.F.Ca.ET.045.04.1.1 TaxID=2493673 RepID=UPI000F74F9DD|nr:TM0106 family RecB-like putative nuclease [Mesorhizobium sp. M1B.F.Ca.ET.045.04.1.1]AZO28378.1 TM0106 family RecB-like putative nuclease [Mesorhizobium sp. M1B.F.Ca.ET.045.04.1.1]